MAHSQNNNSAIPTSNAGASIDDHQRRPTMEPYSPQHPNDIDTTDATRDFVVSIGGTAVSIDYDEDRAPSDFNVSTAADNDDDVNADPWSADGCIMRCALCKSSRRSFHCRDCVQSGDFLHKHHSPLGGGGDRGERFAAKRARHDQLQQRKDALADRVECLLRPYREREALRALLERKRLEATDMQSELERRRRKLDESRELNQRLVDSIADARKKFPGFSNNVENLRCFVEERLKRNDEMSVQRDDLQRRVKQRVRRLIGCLTTYVFPISEVKGSSAFADITTTDISAKHPNRPSASPSSTTLLSTTSSNSESVAAAAAAAAAAHDEKVSALSEATRTAYVGGRWVLQDSTQHELHHMVVAPTLPANGDYSAYVDWITSVNRDGGGGTAGTSSSAAAAAAAATAAAAAASAGGMSSGGELSSHTSMNDAYRISAALTYSAQMVNLLSYYLDVHLPYRLSYADFCNKELSRASFNRRVARLNGNIMALCHSQNVVTQHLDVACSLTNLTRLLAADELGLCGPVNVCNGQSANMEQLNADLLAGGHDSDTDDENSFPHEWEAVPYLSPHETFSAPIAVPPLPPTPASLLSMTTQQTTSMAGDLVTNAVASVTSIWRGFTGGR